jgi:hypothetical protein
MPQQLLRKQGWNIHLILGTRMIRRRGSPIDHAFELAVDPDGDLGAEARCETPDV